jgi:NNP family nitrate/nitrite transporter-like MFS transporter
MASYKTFLKAGHPPTLFAAFLYFDFCFAVWVLNGAMAPFITKQYGLTPVQTGWMISLPTLAGALMRFPLGVMSQYIGRKNAALVEMSCIMVAMAFGYFYVNSYSGVLAMGVLLGIAGASFGVALALGSGWFPPESKGLAMGIAGAGNSGTAIATFFAPQLAKAFGWQTVYGFAGLMMLLPFFVMLFLAKEPPDREDGHRFVDHIKCLWQADGWMFNAVYIITFGGFLGLATYLPTFFHDQFHIEQSEAKYYTTFAVLMGSCVRVLGGWLADRLGGIVAVSVVLIGVIGAFLATSAAPSLMVTVILLICCFAALGLGNGALFQLVPLRWPATTAVAGSMIGEIGALGGAILPNVLAYSKQHTGSYSGGFIAFAGLAAAILVVLRIVQRFWVGKWIAPGGRALPAKAPVYAPDPVMVPAMLSADPA